MAIIKQFAEPMNEILKKKCSSVVKTLLIAPFFIIVVWSGTIAAPSSQEAVKIEAKDYDIYKYIPYCLRTNLFINGTEIDNEHISMLDAENTVSVKEDSTKSENRITQLRKDGDRYILKIELKDYESSIEISVFNILGKKIRIVHEGPPKKDADYPYEIYASDLPNGVYICVVHGKDFRLAKKFIISR